MVEHSTASRVAAGRARHFLDDIKSHLNTARRVTISVVAVAILAIGPLAYWTLRKPARTEVVYASTAPSTQIGSAVKPTISRGPTVLIVPLTNNTGDSIYDVVVSILAEHITASLGRFSSLRVIGRSLAESKTTTNADELARKMSAQYVVAGSLRASTNGASISIQLIDALTASSVWSKNFEVTSEIVSSTSLQDEIAGQC